MRVVVLGAGYAGLTLAHRLEKLLPSAAEIVVVDETGTHLVQHELHRVVRRPGLADDLTIPLADLLDRATVREARVEAVDTDERAVDLADGDRLAYDVGAICLGAETDFYGLAGVREHATPLKRVEHALSIREDYLNVLADDGRVVVGGAGLSGIQVAGEFAVLARERDADPEIVLLEQEDAVAPGFDEPFQAAVREALERRGVDVRTGTEVAGADADAVRLAGEADLPYDQLVWTGGIRGTAALRSERPTVRATLELADGTFALGDAARVIDAEGRAVPASAQAAIRQARVAARNIQRVVEHDDDALFDPRLEPFSFEASRWLVSVGDGAVAQVGPSVVTGSAAKTLKAGAGARYLSSVGAVRNAVDLVNEELGLAD